MDPEPVEEWVFFDHRSVRRRIHDAMVWKGENLKLTGTPPSSEVTLTSEFLLSMHAFGAWAQFRTGKSTASNCLCGFRLLTQHKFLLAFSQPFAQVRRWSSDFAGVVRTYASS